MRASYIERREIRVEVPERLVQSGANTRLELVMPLDEARGLMYELRNALREAGAEDVEVGGCPA